MGGITWVRSAILGALALLAATAAALAEPLTRAQIAPLVTAPMELGEKLNDKGVWSLLNGGGEQAGYVFETAPMAPLPGFSGAPINMLVMLDNEGRFIDVKLLSQNEPIFVSGLGVAPFLQFLRQYRGHSISDTLVVGTPYGKKDDGSALVYLDGVTKATASVRIANESILAAVHQVAREKLQGITSAPPAYPDPAHHETLTWADLVKQGIATHKVVLNREMDQAFAGTKFDHDDPEAAAHPDQPYLDLWIVDLGPPSIAEAVLDKDGLANLRNFLTISPNDEPILLIDTGRHGLVSKDFVRNTSPDWLSATQEGLPVALRDSDLFFGLRADIPQNIRDGAKLILRTDRRLGFDPTREWTLHVKAIREHGAFMPDLGSVTLDATHKTDARFFKRSEGAQTVSPLTAALHSRADDLYVLGAFLAVLLALLGPGMNRFAAVRAFPALRLGILAFVTVFIGWWGQGQLSIVTVLGVIRTAWDKGSFVFLLYDPFGLLVWAAAILGFVLWGRGFFCGWLCPFGALQEFADRIGRLLRLPQIQPSRVWDDRLKGVKYVILAGLVAVVFAAPGHTEAAAEVEPFKTAITTFFLREWYYVAYAAFWLVFGMVFFKGYCRYVCPLGAVMAIGGLFRVRRWIERRVECGSPCQLCRVKCRYGSIEKSGAIRYDECFQCLDCVTIHDDPEQCVPLILAARPEKRAQFTGQGVPAE